MSEKRIVVASYLMSGLATSAYRALYYFLTLISHLFITRSMCAGRLQLSSYCKSTKSINEKLGSLVAD